jgi:hypothetical protein
MPIRQKDKLKRDGNRKRDERRGSGKHNITVKLGCAALTIFAQKYI